MFYASQFSPRACRTLPSRTEIHPGARQRPLLSVACWSFCGDALHMFGARAPRNERFAGISAYGLQPLLSRCGVLECWDAGINRSSSDKSGQPLTAPVHSSEYDHQLELKGAAPKSSNHAATSMMLRRTQTLIGDDRPGRRNGGVFQTRTRAEGAAVLTQHDGTFW